MNKSFYFENFQIYDPPPKYINIKLWHCDVFIFFFSIIFHNNSTIIKGVSMVQVNIVSFDVVLKKLI